MAALLPAGLWVRLRAAERGAVAVAAWRAARHSARARESRRIAIQEQDIDEERAAVRLALHLGNVRLSVRWESSQAPLNFRHRERVHFHFDLPQMINGSLHGIAFVTAVRFCGIGLPAFRAKEREVRRAERQIRNWKPAAAPLALVNEIRGLRFARHGELCFVLLVLRATMTASTSEFTPRMRSPP